MTDSHPYASQVARFTDLDLDDAPAPRPPASPAPAPLSAAAIGTELGTILKLVRRGASVDAHRLRVAALLASPLATAYMHEKCAWMLDTTGAAPVAPVLATGAVAPGDVHGRVDFDRTGDRLHDASGRSGATIIGSSASRATLSVPEAIAAWGLDWRPVLVPLTAEGGARWPLARGLIRGPRDSYTARGETDPLAGQALNTVGGRYTCLAAEDVFSGLGSSTRVERGGETHGGRRQWLQLRTPEHDFRGPEGYTHETFTVAWAEHGLGAAGFCGTATCTVCQNTAFAAIGGQANRVTFRHTASGPEKLAAFQAATEAGAGYYGALRAAFERLAGVKVDEDKARKALSTLIEGTSTRSDNIREAIYQASLTAPGAVPGTAYGLWQGSTYYIDNLRSIRQGTDRLGDSLFDGGAALRERAWQTVSVLV